MESRVIDKPTAIGAVATAVLTGLLAVGVLDRFPASGDEHAYLLQGSFFSQGSFSGPGFPQGVRDLFEVDHVLNGEQVVAKYPPGWPAILALGFVWGAPWLLLPLTAATCCLCIGAITRRLGLNSQWAIAALGTSPFFLFNAASFHSHAPFLAICFLSTVVLVDEKNHLRAPLSGALWGLGFLIRPFDAAIYALSLPLLLPRRLWVRWLATAAIGPILFAAYNQVQFGSWMTTGYEAYRPTFAQLYPGEGSLGEPALSNLGFIGPHLKWLAELWAWTPWLVVAGLLGLVTSLSSKNGQRRQLARWASVYGSLSLMSIFFLKPSDGDSYGPRYVFAVLLPLSIFAGALPEALAASSGAVRRTLATALGFATAYAFLAQVGAAHLDVRQKNCIARTIEKQPSPRRRIIIVDQGNPRAAHFFTRNFSPREPTLIARTNGPDTVARLREAYPDRELFAFVRTGEFSGKLVTVATRKDPIPAASQP